ncbi:MAG: FAD-dependent oxidoreductase [Planctomycetota bacterium]
MLKKPTSNTNRLDCIVVGAGPTGLGAALELRKKHHRFCVFEATSDAGGLAMTVQSEAGFCWELGGHVTYSHFLEFDCVFDVYIKNKYQKVERESWISCCGKWIPYPFQGNLRYLPSDEAVACVSGMELAQAAASEEFGSLSSAVTEARSFQDIIDRVFGAGIARVFMEPYNRKVWATDPAEMAASWLGERVALVDARKARQNYETGVDDFGWGPNNTFRFPHRGTGALYEAIADDLKEAIRFCSRLVSVDPQGRLATFDTPNGSCKVAYDSLISTVPLDHLIGSILTEVPPSIRAAANELRYASGDFVGVGIAKPCPTTRSWTYFPDPSVPFYRVTYLSNYSPFFTPPGHYSLLCEISSPPGTILDPEDLKDRTLRGLESVGMLGTSGTGSRRDIVEVWHQRVERSYPVPTVGRDEALAVIIPWLEERGIYSRGRFGLWKYEVANTDHSVMQGVEAVRRIVDGTPETVTGIRYDDGVSHVRPAVAGSGEKRLAGRPLNAPSRGSDAAPR